MSTHPRSVVARTWWIVAAALVAALVASLMLTRGQVPRFSSSTSVIVVPEGTLVESVRDQIDALANLDKRNVVATIAGIAQSAEVLQRASRRAGMADDESRAYRVRAIVRPNTNILDIEALGPDPARCAMLAHEVASIAGAECTNNYRIYRLRVLDDAVAPSRPVSPDLRRNVLVGGVLGLLAGLLIAAGSEWARRALSTPGP